MDSSIELRHLRYFLAVVEELHFGRAAARLRMSQPPLSQAIRKLEQELGMQLLQRTSRSVRLTEAGRVFADEARNVLGCLDVAIGEARRAGGVDSVVRIGSLPAVPLDRVQRFLVALRAREPSLRTEVTHLGSLEQVKRLRTGELDLGIFPLGVSYQQIRTVPMFPGEPVVALLRADHPLAAKDVLTQRDLSDEVLVVFSHTINSALHDWWLATIDRGGYRFRGIHEVASTDPRDVVLAVAGGWGISLGSTTYVAADGSSASVVPRPIDPPLSHAEVGVAWRESGPRQLRGLVETVLDVTRELRASG